MLQSLYFIVKYCRDLLRVVLRNTLNMRLRCLSALFFFLVRGVCADLMCIIDQAVGLL